jgi:hypothetical protein
MITWGDETWAEEMADLFRRIDALFFVGDFTGAADAYPKLLSLFDLPNETGEGYFPGESDPVDMVGIDVKETGARYLRSLLGSNGEWNIEKFVGAYAELVQQFSHPLSLKAILEASPQPLADTDRFLGEVEPMLAARSQSATGYSHPDWHKLLREAVLLRSGTNGLGTLAREQGKAVPETYYEWILALRSEGRDNEALQATGCHGHGHYPQCKRFASECAGSNARGTGRDGRSAAVQTIGLAYLSFAV